MIISIHKENVVELLFHRSYKQDTFILNVVKTLIIGTKCNEKKISFHKFYTILKLLTAFRLPPSTLFAVKVEQVYIKCFSY